jgi:hypothetical protein
MKKVPMDKRIVYKLAVIFPVVNIRLQLQRLYNKKGFEKSCKEWKDRPVNNRELSDIYDGRI